MVNISSHIESEIVMASDTRERILDAALTLFAEKGYEGTNLLDIAESVGIVKSAIYRHFSGKEELWDAVIEMMVNYYEAHFGSEQRLPKIPDTCEELIDTTMNMIDFTIHDTRVKKIRRILLMEQFRDEHAKELATRHFLTGTESIFTKVFEGMMENGSLREGDPAMLAFAYTAPITSMVHLCDREPEKEAEALERIKAFARHFISTYGA